MRILHGPQNIGGMATTLAAAQRAAGHDAVAYTIGSNAFQFRSDVALPARIGLGGVAQAVRHFDVFQFYFGESLLGPSLRDIPMLARLGKRVFFYFCGCDIRDEKRAIFDYEYSTCVDCFPKLCSANRAHAAAVAARFGLASFVSTPDLLEYVPRSVLLPQVIDLALIDRILAERRDHASARTLTVVHAPSNRAIKGTAHVERAVRDLRADGLDVELLLLENIPHEEAMRLARSADIAVDQVNAGAYGQFAAETMALGIPTVTYLRPDLVARYPQPPPLVSAHREELSAALRGLLADERRRAELGAAGFDYARAVHDPDRLAAITLEAYG